MVMAPGSTPHWASWSCEHLRAQDSLPGVPLHPQNHHHVHLFIFCPVLPPYCMILISPPDTHPSIGFKDWEKPGLLSKTL